MCGMDQIPARPRFHEQAAFVQVLGVVLYLWWKGFDDVGTLRSTYDELLMCIGVPKDLRQLHEWSQADMRRVLVAIARTHNVPVDVPLKISAIRDVLVVLKNVWVESGPTNVHNTMRGAFGETGAFAWVGQETGKKLVFLDANAPAAQRLCPSNKKRDRVEAFKRILKTKGVANSEELKPCLDDLVGTAVTSTVSVDTLVRSRPLTHALAYQTRIVQTPSARRVDFIIDGPDIEFVSAKVDRSDQWGASGEVVDGLVNKATGLPASLRDRVRVTNFTFGKGPTENQLYPHAAHVCLSSASTGGRRRATHRVTPLARSLALQESRRGHLVNIDKDHESLRNPDHGFCVGLLGRLSELLPVAPASPANARLERPTVRSIVPRWHSLVCMDRVFDLIIQHLPEGKRLQLAIGMSCVDRSIDRSTDSTHTRTHARTHAPLQPCLRVQGRQR